MKTFRVELDEGDPGVKFAKAVAKAYKLPVKVVVQAMLSGWHSSVSGPAMYEFTTYLKAVQDDGRDDEETRARLIELAAAVNEEMKAPHDVRLGVGDEQLRAEVPELGQALDYYREQYREQRSKRSRDAVMQRYIKAGRPAEMLPELRRKGIKS